MEGSLRFVHIPVSSHTSASQDFRYIVDGYCKNILGNRFIERGDCNVTSSADSQIISRSELASKVKSGMVLEIVIVLRKTIAFQRECLRCGYVNSNAAGDSGWVY